MAKYITHFHPALGWKGRELGYKKMLEVYGKKEEAYTLFLYNETAEFEEAYRTLNKQKEQIFVCEGNIENMMDSLEIYHFDTHALVETNFSELGLVLTQTRFEKSIIRQPQKREIEGVFYSLTKEQFDSIPFESNPITSRRNGLMAVKLNDSVEATPHLKKYIKKHVTAIQTEEEKNNQMKYRPFLKEGVEEYVPKRVHQKAYELAKKYQLSELEFQFLNFFYETGKAMRNGNGQLFFDPKDKGIGWSHDRGWVKEKMKRLIDLKLVKFESRHDCRDKRYTSWYFYDADKNVDYLKHDF